MLNPGALPTPFCRHSTLPKSCCLLSWAFQYGNLTCALPCGCSQTQVPEVLVGTKRIWWELEHGCTLCRALQGTKASELGGAMQDLAESSIWPWALTILGGMI